MIENHAVQVELLKFLRITNFLRIRNAMFQSPEGPRIILDYTFDENKSQPFLFLYSLRKISSQFETLVIFANSN